MQAVRMANPDKENTYQDAWIYLKTILPYNKWVLNTLAAAKAAEALVLVAAYL